jgi:hypothetical protein
MGDQGFQEGCKLRRGVGIRIIGMVGVGSGIVVGSRSIIGIGIRIVVVLVVAKESKFAMGQG